MSSIISTQNTMMQFISSYSSELTLSNLTNYLTICFPWFFSTSKNYITYNLYWSLVSDEVCVLDSFIPSMKIWYYENFTHFSFDYLHRNYLLRAMYLSIIVDYLTGLSVVIKPVNVIMPFNLFIYLFSIRTW